MRRITPESCTACGRGSQQLTCARFPQVRVCLECYHSFNAFMLREGLADMNPLYISIVWDEGPSGNYPYMMEMYDGETVMVTHGPSQYTNDAYTTGLWYVKMPVVDVESENKSNNPLDNL